MKRLKRVVIREELVELTGDWLSALILGQFLYWTERSKDLGDYLNEERLRVGIVHSLEMGELFAWRDNLTAGWFFKSASRLSDELMIDVSLATVSRRIEGLVMAGWIHLKDGKGRNRSKLYRVDLGLILRDLDEMGFGLEGYPLLKRETMKQKRGRKVI